MRYRFVLGFVFVGAQIVLACSETSAPSPTVHVSALDDCDSASFNAAIGAGTCRKNGGVTFAQFNAELSSSHTVTAWQFAPSTLTARVGQSIVIANTGGEVHTFTEVEQFGGGVVPSLNTASGNTTVAPECTHLVAEDFIAAGATKTDTPEDKAGTERYQCCIHPWMRAVVTVASR